MEISEEIQNSPYFTYFLGPRNLIFYSHGFGCHPSNKSIRAVMAFYPDVDGDRILLENNKRYKSLRINGFKEDLPIINALDKEIKVPLLKYFSKDSYTGEDILEIPVSEITKVFKPKESLHNFLQNPPKLIGIDSVHRKVEYMVGILTSEGIPLEDIGFYGSLQCSLFHKDLINDFNDIDLLVYGLEHQEKIMKIASEHKLMDYKRLDRIEERLINIEKRQLDLTEVHVIFEGKETFCHLTQVRKLDDKNTFPDLSKIIFIKDAVDIEGIVVDSSEGFTTPTVFDVMLNNGLKIKILNRYYYFTKAAFKGDKINARGLISSNSKYLILTDTQKHYLLVQ